MSTSNADIAQLFDDMATLLEIKGDSIFKIRAYQMAARTVERLPFPLEQAVQDGMDLKTIPGIGDAISKKICEIIDTGRVQAYDKLEAELPQGILSLIKVPGIGPKTARLVAQELGATSIDELERATLDGRLSELPGLGDKAGENVLRGIRYVRRKQEESHNGGS